ncbi:MAG: preprotein translocase subunit TatB [Tissierellia bacterium]|nr:preprotein translocase subunit TatB [Tissierellia bacterium]
MLDARGLSCPEPVIMIKEAMESKASEYKIMVDNKVALENITRFAGTMGYSVEYKEVDGDYSLTIRK